MSKRLPIFYSALLLTGVNLLLRLAGTSFQVYISGRIGAAGVGLLQLVMSVGSLAMVAGIGGIRTATMYLTAEALGRGKKADADRLLSGCFLYSILCSGVVSARSVPIPVTTAAMTTPARMTYISASCVATAAQMGRLLRKTEDSLRQIARQIAGGDIEATPYRTGRDDTPCRFCDFKEACHFDPTMKKDKLRFLPVETPARVHQILEEEEQA